MEKRDAVSDEKNGTDVQAASKPRSVTSGVETQKRVTKLTAKAFAYKLESLQNDRKVKLNKATNIRKSIQGFMLRDDKTQVQNALGELIVVCDEAKNMPENLLGLLPCDEKEKHEIWFKAKMLSNNECFANAKGWISCNESHAHENGNVVDDIGPNDSVSNVCSKHSSHRSGNRSKSSTTSSAAIKAEADRAALVARAAA